MHGSSQWADALKRTTDGYSLRQLARKSGWGRSTIHEWLTGLRVPTAPQLDDLLDVVGACAATRARLQLRRCAEAGDETSADTSGTPAHATEPTPAQVAVPDGPDAPDGVSDAPPDGPDTPRARRAPGWLLVAVAVLLLAVGLGAGYLWGSRAPRSGVGVPASVVDTGGIGIVRREAPTKDSPAAGSLQHGDRVDVVCLAPDGDPVTAESQQRSSAVWALLSDGTWISDLYLDTDKSWQEPGGPPAPVRLCGPR